MTHMRRWLLLGLTLTIPALIFGLSLIGHAYLAYAEDPPARSSAAGASSHQELPLALRRKIDPDLLRAVLENPQGPHRFLVHLSTPDLTDIAKAPLTRLQRRRAVVERLRRTAEASQRELRALLAKRQAEGHVLRYKSFWVFNGFAVTADGATLLELAARPEVKHLRADRKHWLPEPDRVPGTYVANPGPGVEWGVERIRAPMVWQALGIDGTGVVVASMDTGVDWQHPDLRTAYRGYNEKGMYNHTGNWYCATDEQYLYPGDGHGHGTHTTATMVGRNGVGVAPGAKWIAVKVFHNQGYTYDSWIHDAFQWVLAPAGNPDLAPDIINGSWGNDVPEDESLRPDIQAVRAAGIIPVFAIGNNGPEPASLGAPASYPEVLAVGAIDPDGEVTDFSSRGPSPWGQIKPEVVAPGALVRSAVPGGGREAWNGTSMAAPHVSGVVALMLQANPDLDFQRIVDTLEKTAVPIGTPVPNNVAGWGRVDAYAAVAAVMEVGFLQGQVLRAVDGHPIPGATVSVAVRDGAPFAHTTTDAQGRYEFILPPGPYELHVSAFAYETAVARGIRISRDATLTRNVILNLLPAGVLFGQVTDEATGGPLRATLYVVDTPVHVETDPETGRFSVPLPPGRYTLKVVSRGHRVAWAKDVDIAVNATTIHNFKLQPAPTILVVDSGAWYYGSQLRFFTQALEDLDYPYDVWTIKDLDTDIPSAEVLKAYDITIWSAPRDAPGFIGASGTITNYLEAGGRLLLTGQDVGYWDGGGSQNYFAAYYRDYLRAIYIRDDSGMRKVIGASGTSFEGLTLGLGRADSARNQRFPDEIAPFDAEHTRVILHYVRSGAPDRTVAGLWVGRCLPYRVVYLAFGFEGVEGREVRATLLQRALDALLAPPPVVDAVVAASQARQIAPAGSVVDHVVTVRNVGRQGETFSLSLDGGAWPASLWSGDFSHPLDGEVHIEACEAITVGVRVQIPPDVGRNRRSETTLWVRSIGNDAPVAVSTTLTTKTPAPILLVDDDRWFQVEDAYKDALNRIDVPFDYWPVGWNPGEALGSPSEATLAMYPVVMWFTGYDWFQTLSQEEEAMLARYLDRGGRFFLSAQDYLYTNGVSDFARDYLGVITFTEDMTSTQVIGVAGNPISDGLGPYALDYPYTNHSDTLTPAADAQVVFRGKENLPVALARTSKTRHYKTLFFAFPFEALHRPAAQTVMGRIVDWLSPLHDSSIAFDRPVAAEGQRLRVRVRLHNDARFDARGVTLSSQLPAQMEYVLGSLSGADYDPATRVMRWRGTVPAGQTVELRYELQLASTIPDGTVLTHRVEIDDGTGMKLNRAASVRVDVPDLSTSRKEVQPARAALGDELTYTLTLSNTGTIDGGMVEVTDELPPELQLVEGSLSASSGRFASDGRHIVWQGSVPRERRVTIRYRARVVRSGVIRNVARIDDGYGVVVEREAVTVVATRVYLPLVMRSRTD